MKLNELLEVINENTYVNVYNVYDRIIAKYDGKNSIPNILNNFEVNEIYTVNSIMNKWKVICVIIKTEYTQDEVYMLSE